MALKFRRGSTAQQSGSLAFGEPYVNTTLGTLVIGGPTGDIVLSAGGTGSTGNFGAISGSGLDITGNANIAGNLTLGGAITIGDATADTVNVVASLSSSLIPATTNAFDLGSASKIWRDLYISTGSIKFVEGTSVVKTLNADTLTALESATGSANSAIAALNTYTSSNDTTNTTQTSRLDQLSTASGSAITRLGALEVETSNLESFTSSINTTIKSKLDTDGVVSGSSQVSLKSTTEFSAFDTALSTITGSLISSASTAKTTNDTQDGRLTNLESFSGSQLEKDSTLATYTGSVENRFATLGELSGSFARVNSANTFNGNQTVSGSLTVTQDFIVLGSSSIQNISSSTLNIGTNLITVAVNNPSVRFGGLAVIDSGSAGGSGSFLYDSVQDEFIFVHRGNGTNITSSHFIMGPETYDDLGNESYVGQHRVIKGSGNEHIAVSNIFDNGTIISLGSNVEVTGSITLSGTVDGVDVSVLNSNINSFSASALSRLGVLEVETANLETFSGSTLTRLTALEVETANLEAFTSSINTTIKSKLDADGVISSSAQLTTTFDTRYLNTNGDGVVSGSSQIAFSGVTGTVSNAQLANSTISGISLGSNLATLTIGTGLSGTSYNGSGAVTIANTGVTSAVAGTGVSVSAATGAVTFSIGQAVATTSNVTFGTVTATGDIVAFSTSDKRHKNNIQTISNAVLKVKQLNGVTWEWNDDVNEVTKSTPKTGLIAQEVKEILPQVVTERADGFLALDYSKMVGLLVEAIKEQQIQIDQLKAQIGSK
jgi:hypothetical protein